MITLYTFGPHFGLPDPSPFVTKAEVLLQLAGLDYRCDTKGYSRAPKGKLPYIADDGLVIADSSLIRFHLERRYGIDFDLGLGKTERAAAWAMEKMLEDHLYWGLMSERWMNRANFNRGPRKFFQPVPAPVRPLVIAKVHRDFRRTLHGQGIGRHSPEDATQLMNKAIDTLADALADKPYLMGDVPCGADASVAGLVIGLLCEHFDGPMRARAATHSNLVAYRDRSLERWFPAFARPKPAT
jgi:glutathione S-transferase